MDTKNGAPSAIRLAALGDYLLECELSKEAGVEITDSRDAILITRNQRILHVLWFVKVKSDPRLSEANEWAVLTIHYRGKHNSVGAGIPAPGRIGEMTAARIALLIEAGMCEGVYTISSDDPIEMLLCGVFSDETNWLMGDVALTILQAWQELSLDSLKTAYPSIDADKANLVWAPRVVNELTAGSLVATGVDMPRRLSEIDELAPFVTHLLNCGAVHAVDASQASAYAWDYPIRRWLGIDGKSQRISALNSIERWSPASFYGLSKASAEHLRLGILWTCDRMQIDDPLTAVIIGACLSDLTPTERSTLMSKVSCSMHARTQDLSGHLSHLLRRRILSGDEIQDTAKLGDVIRESMNNAGDPSHIPIWEDRDMNWFRLADRARVHSYR